MGLLDRLKDTFFKEVDVYPDDVKDTSFQSDEDIQEEKPKIKRDTLTRNTEREEVVFPRKAPIEATPIVEKVEKVQKEKTIDITADVVKEKKEVRPRQTLERKEFEIPLVISPIHGTKETEQEVSGSSASSIKKPKRSVKDPLGTIISPFYGNEELDEEEEEVVEVQAEAQLFTTVHTDDTQTSFEDNEEIEEIENISLDQMVDQNEKEEKEIIQFSLLGDDTTLRSLADDEVSEEEDEELPF